MTELSLEIKDLFNYLATHFYDQFSRMNATSFNKYINARALIKLTTLNNETPIKFNNLSKCIEFIFEKHDYLNCGENAIRFVNFVKTHKDNLSNMPWLSSDLIAFCSNAIPQSTPTLNPSSASQPPPHQHVDSTSPTDDSTILPGSTDNQTTSSLNNTTLSDQTLTDLRNNLNTDINNALKNFMLMSMSRSVKNEHYQELEELLIKFTKSQNSLTVNKAYNTNSIFQATISKDQFPSPWLKNDPQFVQGFDQLITTFQTQIQNYNITYITEIANKQRKAVDDKIEFIGKFDSDATAKCTVLEDKVTNDLKKLLTKSVEKVNRLITLPSQPRQISPKASNNTAQPPASTSSNPSVNVSNIEQFQKPHRNKSNSRAHNRRNNSTTGQHINEMLDRPMVQTYSSHQHQLPSNSSGYGPTSNLAQRSYHNPSDYNYSRQNQQSFNNSNQQTRATNNYGASR